MTEESSTAPGNQERHYPSRTKISDSTTTLLEEYIEIRRRYMALKGDYQAFQQRVVSTYGDNGVSFLQSVEKMDGFSDLYTYCS